jgi:hypothetical protein
MNFATVDLGDGTIVAFESDGSVDALNFTDRGFDELEKMAKGAGALASTFRKWVTPDELSLELSVGLSGEVGWFFAKSKLDAVITLSATWNNPVPDNPDHVASTRSPDV